MNKKRNKDVLRSMVYTRNLLLM